MSKDNAEKPTSDRASSTNGQHDNNQESGWEAASAIREKYVSKGAMWWTGFHANISALPCIGASLLGSGLTHLFHTGQLQNFANNISSRLPGNHGSPAYPQVSPDTNGQLWSQDPQTGQWYRVPQQQSGPIQGQPIQGQPIQGQPIQGQPIQGQPIQGQPMPVQPVTGQPVTGQPMKPNTVDQYPVGSTSPELAPA